MKNILLILGLSVYIIAYAQAQDNTSDAFFNYNSSIELKNKEKLNDSPYSLFGDNTTVLKTDHERNLDHSLKIPLIEDDKTVGIFELNFQTAIATIKNLKGEIVTEQKMSLEDVARFLTIDPHSERYYSISPYVYCFNNPLKFVDPDGRDGRLTGSGTEDDPFIITANYYYQNGSLNNDQLRGVNSAISSYNNNGRNHKIRNEDGTDSYVRFNMSVQGVDDVASAVTNDIFTQDENGEAISFGNRLEIANNPSGNGDEYGSANGWRVSLNQENINASVTDYNLNARNLIPGIAIHEIGHNLGLDHTDRTNIMSQANISGRTDMAGRTTYTPTMPRFDRQGAAIIVNRVNQPRVGSLGVVRRP